MQFANDTTRQLACRLIRLNGCLNQVWDIVAGHRIAGQVNQPAVAVALAAAFASVYDPHQQVIWGEVADYVISQVEHADLASMAAVAKPA